MLGLVALPRLSLELRFRCLRIFALSLSGLARHEETKQISPPHVYSGAGVKAEMYVGEKKSEILNELEGKTYGYLKSLWHISQNWGYF